MRHRVKGRKLSRTAAHRKATMRALSMALIREHRISTTVAKAKELRGFIEPLITRAKEDSHHNRKQVFSSLQNKDAVTQLFTEIGPKVGDRPGGYTRVIKTGYRQGDAAEMAIIELVDFNDIAPEGGKTTKKKRTRRAGKSNTPTSAVAEETKSEAAEEEKQEVVAEAEVEETSEKETEATEESGEEEKK
jgi:large subunit ribosomal protein L17|tara:strand:- start:231 stop:800 length:570 start_codon:yes stop_codon:yes gene_type:complete